MFQSQTRPVSKTKQDRFQGSDFDRDKMLGPYKRTPIAALNGYPGTAGVHENDLIYTSRFIYTSAGVDEVAGVHENDLIYK